MPAPDHSPPALHDLLYQHLPHVRVTQALLAANILVFLATLASGAGLWHSSNAVQLAWGANFGPATQDGQWWRLGSALFLHFGVLHLALNMWALWDGGQLVERMYGPWRFAAIYFASGLCGNLLSLVTHGGQAVSGGASGAIFGVYGALIVFLWQARRALHPHEFRWLFWGALGFSAATIAFGLLVTGIDNAAHVGGLVSGLCGGTLLLRRFEAEPQLPRVSRLLAGGALLGALALLVTHLPEPAYRWRDEVQARREIVQFLRDDREISRTWQHLISEGQRRGASFDELAGRIDDAVGDRYEESFEQLAQLPGGSALPSAATIERLRDYAQAQRDASRELADGLRAHDPAQIRAALEKARRARQTAPGVPEKR